MQQFAGVGVVNDGSHRNRNIDGRPVAPRAVAAFAMPPALGRVFGIETEMQQRVVMLAGDQDDVAAAPAIAAAGTSAWDVLLAAKRQAAVAAVARFYADSVLHR